MARPRSAVVAVARQSAPAWWSPHVDWHALDCVVDYWPIVLPDGRPRRLWSRSFVSMCWQCLTVIRRARRGGHAYLLTFECDWPTFIVAAMQTLLRMRTPRHVVLQFIMREKSGTVASRVKYVFMRWCFRSIYRCVCSARAECDYYAAAFGWPQEKLLFVPFHTDPEFLNRSASEQSGVVLAAGRTFRDYETFLRAVTGLDVPVSVIASPAALGEHELPPNVELRYDIPGAELVERIAACMIVVIPLVPRQISIGQSVLLEAMAMGKAVIVTRVNGTEDYVEDMVTGVLVAPGDPVALRAAIVRLTTDAPLRARLGAAARARVLSAHLPQHYAVEVSRRLQIEVSE